MKANDGKRRVCIVDDHALLRFGLSELITQKSDLEVVGQAATAEEALSVIGSSSPHLVVLDITLGGMSGLEFIRVLKEKFPGLKILVLSMHDEEIYAERAIRAGAHGYVMKAQAINDVIDAIRRVLEGDIYLSRAMSRRVLEAAFRSNTPVTDSPVQRLTDRELEVFKMIGHWKGTTEIARDLNLSVKTIETYQSKLKEKLGVRDANQLLHQALRWVQETGE